MRVNLHILSPSYHHFAAKIISRVMNFNLMIKTASLEYVLRVLSLTSTIAVGTKSLGLMDRFCNTAATKA